jgi:hypothetical protein
MKLSEQAADQRAVAETTNSQRRTWARPAYLLVPLIALPIALGLFVFLSPRSGTLQVKGPLSARDVQAIRHELKREERKAIFSALRHGQFDLLWKELWIFGSGSLVSLDSTNGTAAVARFRGRDSTRNGVELQLTVTNNAGAWSFTGARTSVTGPTKQ